MASSEFRERLDEYERRLILEALEQSGGHRRRAAAALGLLATTLHEKMKRLGIWTPARPSDPDAEAAGAPAGEEQGA